MVLFRISSELAARIGSAFALSAVAVFALWSSLWAFAILVVTLAAVMCWEWGRAVRSQDFDASHAAHTAAIFVVSMAAVVSNHVIAVYALLIGVLLVVMIAGKPYRLLSGIGIIYIGLPAFVLIWLRSEGTYGIHAVFFILFVVASHDTFAMLVGKMFKGPKLWPVLSPQKTWSGVIGGLIASCLAGALFALFFGYEPLLWLTSLGLIIGFAGLIGDLFESAFKRYHGLKHASALIPGHGGVLDRFDGVIIAALVAGLIGGVLEYEAPAKALLMLGH